MQRSMILLVSGQPMANLLTALDPALGINNVHLIVSGDMRASGHADRLVQVLEGRGLSCHWHDGVSDPFAPGQMRAIVQPILAGGADAFVVNLTGGTKPMALGAYQAAQDAGVQDIIYLDHDRGRIHFLDSDNRPPLAASAELSPEEVVCAHGFTGKSTRPGHSSGQLALAQLLFERLQGGDLHAWNRLMDAARRECAHGQNWVPSPVAIVRAGTSARAASPWNREALDAVLTAACRRQYCGWDGQTLTIDHAADHQFLAGGWFELVAQAALEQLAPVLGLRDIRANFEVAAMAGSTGKPVRNEVDIIAMQGRHLLVFECKTLRATGTDREQKMQEIFYKLDHLQHLGGLGTRLFLLSCDEVDSSIRARYENSRNILLLDRLCPDNLQERLQAALQRLG